MDPNRAAEPCEQCQDQRAARARLQRLDEHRRVCSELEELTSLTRYYAEHRRVRRIPLAQVLEERWWAA